MKALIIPKCGFLSHTYDVYVLYKTIYGKPAIKLLSSHILHCQAERFCEENGLEVMQ